PEWGFASSPLVAQGTVMVFAGGPKGKSVLGYRTASGELAWAAGSGEESYSSPHLATLDKVQQALFSSNIGLTSFDPATGEILWDYPWAMPQGAPVAQPALLGNSEILLGNQMQGTRRLRVTRQGSTWGEEEAWPKETRAIKPYFNDLVIYQDHIYGFDGSFFT